MILYHLFKCAYQIGRTYQEDDGLIAARTTVEVSMERVFGVTVYTFYAPSRRIEKDDTVYFPVFLTINPPHKNKVFPIINHQTLISVIVPILILPPLALHRSFPLPRLQSDTSTCFTDRRRPLRTTVQLIAVYSASPTSLSSVSSHPSATRRIPRTTTSCSNGPSRTDASPWQR